MIHDSFCRCRTCKPPLVGEQAAGAFELSAFAVLFIGFIVAGTIAAYIGTLA